MVWKDFVIDEIERIVNANKMSKKISEKAKNIYKTTKVEGIGNLHSDIALSCVYLASKNNRLTLEEIDNEANPFAPEIDRAHFEKMKKARLERAKKYLAEIKKSNHKR